MKRHESGRIADLKDEIALIEAICDGLRHQRDEIERKYETACHARNMARGLLRKWISKSFQQGDAILGLTARIADLEDENNKLADEVVRSHMKIVELEDKLYPPLVVHDGHTFTVEMPRNGEYVINFPLMIYGIKPPTSWSEWCAVWGIPCPPAPPQAAQSETPTGRQSRANS